jgi:hypothetical protein
VHIDLVEAHDSGVAAVPPRPLWITFGGRRYGVIQLADEAAATDAVLLRHPDIKSVDEHTLEQAVRIFSDKELMRRYSSMDRLAGPLTFLPGPLRRVLGRILLWCFPQPKRLVLPGCFCSELVVKFYDQLDIRLIAGAAVPEHVSPNRLVPPWSLLTVVPDAIITADDIPDDAHGEDMYREDLRTRFLARLVEIREDKELLFPLYEKQISEVAAATEKAKEQVRIRFDLLRERRAADLHAQIAAALSDRSIAPAVRRTFDLLDGRSIFLKVVRNHLRSEQVPDDAGSELRRLHDRAFLELCSRYLRAQALVRMSLARRMPAETGRQAWMRALADWRTQKAWCAQARADLQPEGPLGEDTDAWVSKVMDEVAAEAKAARHVT